VTGFGSTIRPPFGSRANVAIAFSMSAASRTAKAEDRTPNTGARLSISGSWLRFDRLVGSCVAHPGGNVTGFALYEYAVAAKWLDLLKPLTRAVNRVAALSRRSPSARRSAASARPAARSPQAATPPHHRAV